MNTTATTFASLTGGGDSRPGVATVGSHQNPHNVSSSFGSRGGAARPAAASASQAWSALRRHAREEIGRLRLRELCEDGDRVDSLVAVHRSSDGAHVLLADLSRQRVTSETLNHLSRLATARDVRGLVRRLAWGQNDPNDPVTPRRDDDADDHRDDGRGRARSPRRAAFPTTTDPSASSSYASSSSMHMALRAPCDEGLSMLTADGANALDGVREDRERMRRLSDGIRRGVVRGHTGAVLRDVVVVGRGVAVSAARFLYEALRRDEEVLRQEAAEQPSPGARGVGRVMETTTAVFSRHHHRRDGGGGGDGETATSLSRRLRFARSVDPVAVEDAVEGLDPATTVVVVVDVGGDEDTGLCAAALRRWLLSNVKDPHRKDHSDVFRRHVLTVTADDRVVGRSDHHHHNLNNNQNMDPNVFVLPRHSRCEPFTTFTAAGLLPLSIVFGWRIVSRLLAGAHDMDVHFVDTNPRHCLPILLALVDVWNDAFLEPAAGRVLTSFSRNLRLWPAFVAELESQTSPAGARVGVVVADGGDGGHDRLLYAGGRAVPSELVAAMDTQDRVVAGGDVDARRRLRDAAACSLFAHADALALGDRGRDARPPRWRDDDHDADDHRGAGGNRPSTLLLCGRCDAFACGQLAALAEHRAAVKARLWDADPFAARRRVGASLRRDETARVRERLDRVYRRMERDERRGSTDHDDESSDSSRSEDEGGRTNPATTTILTHFAARMRERERTGR